MGDITSPSGTSTRSPRASIFDTVGEAVNDLKGASDRYLHYFGRDLDSSEIDAALGEVVEMRAAV
jgi:hypothetical protein